MGYETALAKGWMAVERLTKETQHAVRLLSDEYSIDVENKRILSVSCNVAAKDFLSILILHYLAQRLGGLSAITGEWISFRQLDGGQGYYANFRKRVCGPLLRKYGSAPTGLYQVIERFTARRADIADASVIIDVFEGVPFLIEAWKADQEFGAEINVLFDKSIANIFCTEDIVVLSEFVAHQI